MLLVLLVALPPAPFARAQAAELVVQSVFPRDMVFLSESEQRVADRIATLTDGALTLRLLGAGAVADREGVFDAVRSNRIPAAWDWLGYRADRIPLAGVVASFPYGPTPVQLAGWLYDGGGLDLLQRAYAAHGLVVVPCHMVVAEAGGWYRREIREVGDFRGLRIRIAGLGAKILRRLGAEPSDEPPGALFDALSEGRLDAVEFSVPVVDQSFGFHRFAKIYYFPGWHQPASLNVLTVNADVWAGLPRAHREAITTACQANVLTTLAAGQRPQMDAVEAFREHGVEVRRFSYAVLKRLQTVSREVLEEEAARDPLVAEGVRTLSAYLRDTQRWESLQHLPP